MNSLEDHLVNLVLGTTLEDKLCNLPKTDFASDQPRWHDLPRTPGRSEKLSISDRQVKFPKVNSFHLDSSKAQALHFFANHELMAIEMMSCACLLYPNSTHEHRLFKKGLLKAISEEQKHLNLYLKQMSKWGVELGDFPLNGFFWKFMGNLKTADQFISLMSLTFEAANLDFSLYYKKIFEDFGDFETAKIMDIVYQDELSHVALGAHFSRKWAIEKSTWQYYVDNLPDKITPARAKGIIFSEKSRTLAGLDHSFIENLKKFDDGFQVTNRKSWKVDDSKLPKY